MTTIVTNVGKEEWEYFLDNSNAATIYHTPQWKTFLEKTFNYESNYLFAKDENDNITGLLPLFYVKSKLTGNRLCCVPFSHRCGILGEINIVKSLIDEAMNYFESTNAHYFEIRDSVSSPLFETQNYYSTYVLDVSDNVENLWKNLSSNARRATRKSEKLGLIAHQTDDPHALKYFYKLNSMTKKELGVPCHPWKFFKNMFDILGNNVSLYVVEYNDEIIAGGIREYYKDTIIAGYAASHPEYKHMNPYNLLNWKSIQDASNNGYQYYDLGRVSYQNEGLMFFKSRWGTIEKKLYYSYFPKNPKSLTDNRSGFLYNIGTKGIKKMPMSLYEQFSNNIFSKFG
ncbi:hypothetical protein LI82_03755 [Methanococcoides methylutens]|uniref:BioF2-like acetyltransferase domain-containing protein n=1 Tax=Methanococcoides methylutens TaxID=2226 RepID=A0A099T2S9_METMT|nr:hypothetical protein LI82_03755 [Methanococcoides methylutens]